MSCHNDTLDPTGLY
nr:millepattes peptide 2 [Oncopeltus fasciatus]